MSIRVHQVRWPAADLAARVGDCEVVACIASLAGRESEPEASLPALNAEERARVESYTNAVVARRFAVGRRMVREMIGAVLGLPARDVPLREGLHGKPYLAAGAPRSLWFSVSHTDDLLVVALSRVADVGVDVELCRGFEQWQRVADRVLHASERRQLDRVVALGADPSEAFLRQWCRVEAELKAIGCGIQGLEAHIAGERPRGLRLADLSPLLLPAELAASGVRHQAAVALCVPGGSMELRRDSQPQANTESPHADTPVASPARASTA